jgi:hypothetical protein
MIALVTCSATSRRGTFVDAFEDLRVALDDDIDGYSWSLGAPSPYRARVA